MKGKIMIFIDGDGPLQDFAKWMVDQGIPLGYDREDTESMFHEKIDRIFIDSPNAKYLEFFKQLYEEYPKGYVKILTAVGSHWPNTDMLEKASENKRMALASLGFRRQDIVVVLSGKDKIEYAKNNDGTSNILFDDKWSTVVAFEKAGGLGMFVPECYIRFDEAGHADRA
jgi:hypothetical protein